ncbi:MAG TPA: hypothetical protein VFN77_12290 [Acetobacteraceae bacterium]|nr:hypothetical protein [Acetobacteraceae bacterium]
MISLVLVIGLYTAGPAIWFNRAAPPILGMPPLYFWFVLVPLLNPIILGALYVIDRVSGGFGNDLEEG